MAATATATAPAPAAAPDAAAANAAGHRPTKPDEAAFKEALAKAEKEHSAVMVEYNAIKQKIEIAQPNRNSSDPSPTQKRRQELIAQLNDIRKKQGAGKNSRTAKLDQIKRIDEQVRSRVAEQKQARSKVTFKSAEDVDREIERLERQVNSGTMKIVDEKKALSDMSGLRKLRKNFSQFDDSQKHIDDLRAKIKEIKDSMDDPEAKALSERYDAAQRELNAIKAEQDEAYKGLSSLRDERSRLQALQRERFETIRRIKDEYYGASKAFRAFEREAQHRAWERRRADRERADKERKLERANRMLAEASDPAYLDEIRRAEQLLHFFDPASSAASAGAAAGGGKARAPLLADSGLGARASRTVDDAGIKGTRLVRKEDRDDEYLPAVKKGKKGRKGHHGQHNGGGAAGFSCPPSVIEDCAAMGINPPMGSADVPAAVEKIKAKLEHWKADQAAQTQKNIDKAKKEIEKIEAEEANEKKPGSGRGSGASTPATTPSVNGKDGKEAKEAEAAPAPAAKKETKEAKEDDDKAVAEVTKDLKDATVEDKKEEKKEAAEPAKEEATA